MPKQKRDGKVTKRTRAATFVRGRLHMDMATVAVMPRTANVVRRVRLNEAAPAVRGGPTVYFKPHDDEEAPSQYAVASTRLARFLGMPNVIAHNAFAKVKNVRGVVSGAVPGSPLVTHKHEKELPAPKNASKQQIAQWVKHNQLEERDGKYYAMSSEIYEWVDFRDPKIQKGMSDLQLFDAITGQVDRHAGNIFIDQQTGQVSGIDDDRSFGEGRPPADQTQPMAKYVGLPALVDETTAEKILAVDPKKLREQLLAAIDDSKELTDKEIDDARLRLEGVQDHLRKLKAQGLLVKKWDDATYQQSIQDPAHSYLGRAVADLEYAIKKAANDPDFVIRNAPPTPPSTMPPLPSVPTTTTTTTATTTTTQPPPLAQPTPPTQPTLPPQRWQPAQRPQQPPPLSTPPPPLTSVPPLSTLPTSPPPLSTPPPPLPPQPSTSLGQPTPWQAAIPPSRAAAARQAATRPREWVTAVPSGLTDSQDLSESDST